MGPTGMGGNPQPSCSRCWFWGIINNPEIIDIPEIFFGCVPDAEFRGKVGFLVVIDLNLDHFRSNCWSNVHPIELIET